MDITLYHYIHCPFCVRVRLALGFLHVSWKSVVLPYNDEKTPIELCGKKMLPIAVIDGNAMNESLDIITAIDPEKRLCPIFDPLLAKDLNEVGELVHSLVMPYWILTPEFDNSSRQYFIKKKEVKRGPFELLIKRRHEFEAPLLKWLNQNEINLTQYWKGNTFSISDIALAAHIWGLHLVPDFNFPDKWKNYLKKIQIECQFSYLMNVGAPK
jgi:glutaredoxin 2